jgi:hypothetical protein
MDDYQHEFWLALARPDAEEMRGNGGRGEPRATNRERPSRPVEWAGWILA